MSARFDDLTPGSEHSFGFDDPIEELAAHSLDQVAPVIDRIEAASDEGLWAAGFVAYEAAPAFDTALEVRSRTPHDPFGALPLAWFGLYRARRRLESPRAVSGPAGYSLADWEPSVTRREYRRAIPEIRRRIERGDTYQTNHTFRLRSDFDGDPAEFYRDLILAQRGPHGAFLDTGRFQVLSASPEQFFHLQGNRIRVRPMKGTIRRGRWAEEDDDLAARLKNSAKDRSENLMIVDLLRNDLGRIAEYGSVEVTSIFALERYATLWQLTSEIEAETRPGTALRDILEALFPSGSITGAPKASTMAIIHELENTPRGVYCGAIGYVAPRDLGETHFNVAIRTVVIDRESGYAEYGTGGGITWDSDTDSEYEEAMLKAKLLSRRPAPFDLLETLRWENNEFLFQERHIERLALSARYFGFEDPEETAGSMLDAHGASLSRTGSARIRLTVNRSGNVRVATDEADLAPFADDPHGPSYGENPVRVAIAVKPVDPQDAMLYHKTTDRRVYETTRAAMPEVDDAVLTNLDGYVTETTIANLAVRIGSEWYTPPVDSGCLPGVYRAELLARGTISERLIAVDALATADEIALINSVRGWQSATLVSPGIEDNPSLA